jgi:hypothetical protein
MHRANTIGLVGLCGVVACLVIGSALSVQRAISIPVSRPALFASRAPMPLVLPYPEQHSERRTVQAQLVTGTAPAQACVDPGPAGTSLPKRVTLFRGC